MEDIANNKGSGTPGVVLLSGGSRGLGQAIVRDFLGRGHKVATFSRAATPFIEAIKREDPQGERFLFAEIDVLATDAVKQFVMTVARRFGGIDVLINNAATGVDGLLSMMRAEEIHRAISLNLEATVHLIQACSRVMLGQDHGNIISITSVNGLRGHTGVSVYSATKAALDGLTRSLARELGPQGIRVNALAPGYFESDLAKLTDEQKTRIARRTPLGRLATVEDLVGAVRFLASPDSKFITGQTLVVDGGFSC